MMQQPAPQAQPQAQPMQQPQQAPQGQSAPQGQAQPQSAGNVDQQVQSAMGGQGGTSGQQGGGDLQNQIDQGLNALPDKDKQFVAKMLTPETVHLFSLLFGPQIAQALSKYADPETILVPVPRQQFMQQMQGGQGGEQDGDMGQEPDADQMQGMPSDDDADNMSSPDTQEAPKGTSKGASIPKIKKSSTKGMK